MATLQLSADYAEPRGDGVNFAVIFHLTGKPDPLPRKLVEVKTTAEALAAFDAYKAEAKATGLPIAVSMKIKDGRAPNGFKKATAGRFFHGVNI